jgi:hypothetical protein
MARCRAADHLVLSDEQDNQAMAKSLEEARPAQLDVRARAMVRRPKYQEAARPARSGERDNQGSARYQEAALPARSDASDMAVRRRPNIQEAVRPARSDVSATAARRLPSNQEVARPALLDASVRVVQHRPNNPVADHQALSDASARRQSEAVGSKLRTAALESSSLSLDAEQRDDPAAPYCDSSLIPGESFRPGDDTGPSHGPVHVHDHAEANRVRLPE